MATVKTTHEEITCDYCRSTISARVNRIELVTGHVGQGTDWHTCTMSIQLTGVIPYGTGNADVCSKCAAKFLREAADKLDA